MSEKQTYEPEDIKAKYDLAFGYKTKMDKLAEGIEPTSEEDRRQLRQMRARSRNSLKYALNAAEYYANQNGEALEEQARSEMDSDDEFQKRTARGYRSTLQEIKDLPESTESNN